MDKENEVIDFDTEIDELQQPLGVFGPRYLEIREQHRLSLTYKHVFVEDQGFCEDDGWWWCFSSKKPDKNGGHGHCIRVNTGTRFYYDQECDRYVRWTT